ncbi:MAG: thioredoxin family protein [Acidobacteria bacterium]|nr:thioredoxin family protein [Acidobacteriota bacterium]MBI3487547.1 thioredoxin family protein [Acidobacteriota bacterium]
MPRPATLPVIDWKAVFDSGLDYKAWLEAAESEDQRGKIEAQRQALNLERPVAAYLAALPRPVHVVAIAEDWCGDVVRHAPVLERMAEAGPALKVRYIRREQHPDVFVRFLTNGGEAIPKFIFLSEGFVECGHWGPMPERCKELISRGKACGDVAAARKKVSVLYEQDTARREVVAELLRLVETAVCPEP